MSVTENETEARQQLASRLEALRRFNALSDNYIPDAEPQSRPDDNATIEDLGNPDEYGLSLEVESISPRWATKTYAWVLSTGGPHEEFQITVDDQDGITAITFVSLPWFDRVEIPLDAQTAAEAVATIVRFVDRFLYLEGPTDAELGGDQS